MAPLGLHGVGGVVVVNLGSVHGQTATEHSGVFRNVLCQRPPEECVTHSSLLVHLWHEDRFVERPTLSREGPRSWEGKACSLIPSFDGC